METPTQNESFMDFIAGETNFEQLPPELLNPLNRELTDKLKKQEIKLKECENKYADHLERVKVMKDHFSNVKNEVVYTQNLIDAKNKEMETEDHLRQLNEREIGRLTSEMKRIETDYTDFHDKLDNIKNEIFKANEKLDKFKIQMNFNQEELEQWQLAEKQKEEDRLTIEKYKRKDDMKIKENSLKIEKLTRELELKKHDMEREITETQAAQIELEKTAEDFKRAHRNRQEFVRQWEEAIQAMNKRDQLIKLAGEKFAQGKIKIREKQEALFAESQYLNIHIQNNKQKEQEIALITREVEKMRRDLDTVRNHISELADEMKVLENNLSKASTDRNNRLVENRVYKEELISKKQKLENMNAEYITMEEDLKNSKLMLGNLETYSLNVDETLKKAENKLKDMGKYLDELKADQYKQSQELFAARKEEANFIAEISGTNAQNKNMLAKIQQMDSEGYKQQELLYNIEFKVQQMERKVSRAKGERTEEEKIHLNQKIDELQGELNQLEETNKMLTSEWTKVLGEVRMMKKRVADLEKENEKLDDNITELKLENSSHETEWKELVKKKEDILVQHDVLNLQLKRLRELLRDKSDDVSGLESKKSELEITLLEKELQIQAYKELLQAEVKTMEDERRRIAMELGERRLQIDKLKNKFEIMVQRMQPSDPESEKQEVSQAEFLIRAIQEREELLRKGDKLNAEIEELEKQDRALQKTLELFRARNILHMSTYKTVNHNDTDVQKKFALEQKIKELDALMSRRLQEKNDYEESARQKQAELEIVLKEKRELEIRLRAVNESKKTSSRRSHTRT